MVLEINCNEMKKFDYKSAGVDINAGNEAVDLIKNSVSSTFTSNVLTGLGSFGSLYDLKPLLNEYDRNKIVSFLDKNDNRNFLNINFWNKKLYINDYSKDKNDDF